MRTFFSLPFCNAKKAAAVEKATAAALNSDMDQRSSTKKITVDESSNAETKISL